MIVLSLTAISSAIVFLGLRYSIIPNSILRDHEINGIASHFYTGIAISLITFLMPMEACFVAIANGIVGDGISGLVKRYHKKIALISMFVSSFIFLTFLSVYVELNFYALISACLAGMIAESTSAVRGYYINDNFSVPVVSSVVYSLFQ